MMEVVGQGSELNVLRLSLEAKGERKIVNSQRSPHSKDSTDNKPASCSWMFGWL